MTSETEKEATAEEREHLTFGCLDAYRNDRLPVLEKERVRDHLSRCVDCADWLLALEDESVVKPDWSALRLRLDESLVKSPIPKDPEEFVETERLELVSGGQEKLPTADPEIASLKRQLQRVRRAAALLLFGLVLSLVWRQLDPRTHVANPGADLVSQPIINFEVFGLHPDSQPVRGPNDIVTMSEADEGVTFILPLMEWNDLGRSFQLRLINPGDQVVWLVQPVSPKRGQVSVFVQALHLVTPGQYRLELLGQDGTQTIETFRFRIVTNN